MIPSTIPNLDDMPLLTIEEGKPVPRARVRNASAARSIFTKMRDDDLVNAANRSECQDLLDGGPPWSEQQMAEANIDMPNINWRGAEQQLERAMAPYYRLSASPEHAVKVKTTYGPEDNRIEINEALSEEITKTLRTSPFYMFQRLLRDHKKIKEGLGIAYHPDDVDWRFRAAGLGQFYFDRQKFACEEDQEVVCAVETMNVTALYKKVAGDDTGNWNRKAVMAALHKAQADPAHWDDWERLTDEMKNNDLAVSSTSPPVKVIHLWVCEFDDTVSHYIVTEVDTGSEDFLYECRGKYNDLSELITLFPDGLGTNAKIHGLRGLLYKIFPMEQERNRFICRYLAAGELAGSLIMQAKDESALNNIGLQYFGNMAVLPPDFNVGQVQMPNLQTAVAPAIDFLERIRNDRVAGYTTENVFDGDKRKTALEISAHLEQAITLSESQVDLHYLCEDRLAQQTVRRMTRRTYVAEDPGGREITALHRRLLRRDPTGELLEAFFRIDHTETRAGRAIGDGSAGKRTLALQRMDARRGGMDDAGRYKLDRWVAIDQLGSAAADELYPPAGRPRSTPHDNIAAQENVILFDLGRELEVQPSDPHLTHLRHHAEPLAELRDAEKNGEIPIEEMAVRARTGWLHSVEHMDALERSGGDEATLDEAMRVKQFLQQVGEPIENGLKRAQKMAEEQAAEGGEGGQAGPTPQQIAEVEKFNEEMRQRRERFELEQQQRAAKAEQDMAITSAKTAHKMALDSREQAAKRATAQ